MNRYLVCAALRGLSTGAYGQTVIATARVCPGQATQGMIIAGGLYSGTVRGGGAAVSIGMRRQ